MTVVGRIGPSESAERQARTASHSASVRVMVASTRWTN